MSNITHAAVGIIRRNDGWVLLGQRPQGKPWAGYWEFPGGKVEDDETPGAALVRELQEELGIKVTQYYPWITRSYDYPAKFNEDGTLNSPAKTVKLHFFIVEQWQGLPQGLEQQQLVWQRPASLEVSPMLPANAPVMKALSLPEVYAISHLQEMGEQRFFEALKIALENGLQMLQLREKQLSANHLRTFAEKVLALTAWYGAKVFINSDETLARSLQTGVHFTSAQLMNLEQKPLDILCGAACHNPMQLAQAAKLGLDYVTLSPVNATLSHSEAIPLGWHQFADWIKDYPLPVFALGGMHLDALQVARQHGAHGIALQRAIWV